MSNNNFKELTKEEIEKIRLIDIEPWLLGTANAIWKPRGLEDVFLKTNCHITMYGLLKHYFGDKWNIYPEKPKGDYYGIDLGDEHCMFRMGDKIVQSCFRVCGVTITNYNDKKSLIEHSLCHLEKNIEISYYY